MAPRAEMHQVVVAGDAVDRGVLRHRRDDDAVLERRAAQRNGVNIGGIGPCGATRWRPGGGGDPVFVALDVDLVAQAQVLVADALAAREQRVGELLGRQVDVAVDVLEPLGRVARRVLDLQHLDAAHRLVVLERAGEVAGRRPMQRASSIASSRASLVPEPIEKCAVCAASPISTTGARPLSCDPALADDAREADPLRRAAQVRRVRHQRVAVEVLGEQLLAEGDRVFLLHRLEAAARQTRSGVSTMKVEVSSSKR
jgi:hypothetical protein